MGSSSRQPFSARLDLHWRARFFQARYVARALWQRIRGTSGRFRHGEDSERARLLAARWDGAYGSSTPLGYLLRCEHPERWVRFHSLPGSKQYADSPEERAEILRRQNTLLRELRRGDEALVLITVDWGPGAVDTGWAKRQLRGSWPWRIMPAEEPEDPPVFVWVASPGTPSELDALLLLAAEEEVRFLLAPSDLRWLFCPYPGGIDLILESSVERDALAHRHEDWAPPPGRLR